MDLARQKAKPVAQLAHDFGISDGIRWRRYDSSMANFFHTLQLELLDQHQWNTRRQLALAVFEWIEAWCHPFRRRSSIKLSPIDFGLQMAAAAAA